jgi:hypothetical protein
VTSDPDKIRIIEEQIAQSGGVNIWEAEEQVQNFRDRRAEQIHAELAANPELLQSVSAIGAESDSFALEPMAPKKNAPKPKADKPKAEGGAESFKMEES